MEKKHYKVKHFIQKACIKLDVTFDVFQTLIHSYVNLSFRIDLE